MEFTVTRSDGRLHVVGEMSIYTAAALKQEIFALARDGEPLYLDLAQVTALDSAGLQIVLMLRRLAQASGVAFSVVQVSEAAREVLDLCGLGESMIAAGAAT